MDQDATRHGARPWPRRLRVRWEPTPLPKKGRSLQIFGPFLLWPNGCMDQDGTWHGDRPQPRQHCVRWKPSSPPPKGGEAPSPIFSPFQLWPNGCMHQDATWYGGRPQPPEDFVLDGDKDRPLNFRPMFIIVFCDFVRTLHRRYWFVQVIVFYAFYF